MACYVDEPYPAKDWPDWKHKTTCHLMCDTTEELDTVAILLGRHPSQRQHSGKPREHYDLCERERDLAIRLHRVLTVDYYTFLRPLIAKRKRLARRERERQRKREGRIS